MKACFVFCLFFFKNFCFGDDFSIVDGILDDKPGDIIAAFGDFNADKRIDIVVINNAGRGIDLHLARQNSAYERKALLTNESLSHGVGIVGVMAADFNGDAMMDILVSTKLSADTESPVQVAVYWGNETGIDTENPFRFSDSFVDEPILFDYHADMMPDLLTESASDHRNVVWLANATCRNFSQIEFPTHMTTRVPHSSAFIDLDTDFNADLIVTTADNNFAVFTDNNFTAPNMTVMKIDTNQSVGQSSFADFNQDGYIDQVVPTCTPSAEGDKCSDSAIYIRDGANKTQWLRASDLAEWNFVWNFHSQLSQLGFMLNIFPTLRVGDYDMDGYPDLLTVMYSQKEGIKPLLLQNVPKDNGELGRKFVVKTGLLPDSINSTLLATFYDYGEDGMPDILMTSLSRDGALRSILVRNNLALDTCFLKVTVVSGLCSDHCPNGRKPYGVNVPGPTVMYNTTQANGKPQASRAGQLSQSAHFALQLPYVSFGLGQTPNFVDEITVGIPTPEHNHRQKSWTQIIPNAQLIVNPNPINDVSGWRMQLFLVPSQQIYLTGIALLATCVLLAIIVGILLWNERREDKLEKKNESQKFHFDAM